MTFRFIEEHQARWPVRLLCETLAVSPAGYYAWRQRPRSDQAQRRDALLVEIRAIHAQGGLAVPAHPLVPYPLCAQGRVLRRLLEDPDPATHPDAIEAFNPTMLGRPWHSRVVRFAEEHGLPALGNSDAHQAIAIGTGWSTFAGRTAMDMRVAIEAGATRQHGSFHGTGRQLVTFGDQLRKYGADARASIRARVRRDGTGRDLGYPGGAHRPPRFDEAWRRQRSEAGAAAENRDQ
jgi:hypothetical protein